MNQFFLSQKVVQRIYTGDCQIGKENQVLRITPVSYLYEFKLIMWDRSVLVKQS